MMACHRVYFILSKQTLPSHRIRRGRGRRTNRKRRKGGLCWSLERGTRREDRVAKRREEKKVSIEGFGGGTCDVWVFIGENPNFFS